MWRKIVDKLVNESKQFVDLGEDLRRMLSSYFLYLIAYPLLMTFTNAYLWRYGQDLKFMIAYNLCYCMGLPLGFYINGLLLRRFHILKLYLLGSILQGMGSILVVFSGQLILSKIAVFGMIFGLGAGVYWGNKNYLSLRLTVDRKRYFYNTMESAGDMLINILVPALIGLIIAFGDKTAIYEAGFAYQFLMIAGFILVVLSGLVMQKTKVVDVGREPLRVKKASVNWQLVRIYNFLRNLVVGAELILPSVLVMSLVGGEGSLGILGSAASLITAVTLYLVGRKGNMKKIWLVVLLADLLLVLGASGVAIYFSAVSVVIYTALSTMSWALSWSPGYTLVMEVMDNEVAKNGEQYGYVCDNEVYFNLGRVVGLLVIVGIWSVGLSEALRYSMLLLALLQLLTVFPIWILSKKVLK